MWKLKVRDYTQLERVEETKDSNTLSDIQGGAGHHDEMGM
jgi:hypothetical protein